MKNTWKKVVSLVSILCLMVTVVAVPVNTSATERLFYAPFENGDQCGFAETEHGKGSSVNFEVGSKGTLANENLRSDNDYRIHLYSYEAGDENGVYKNFDTAYSQKVLYGFDLAGGKRLQQSPTDVMFLGSSDVDGELRAGESDDTMFGLIKVIYAADGGTATGITFYADDILTEGAVSAAAKEIYTTTDMAVWHHVDAEIDFGGKNINYYIDGLYVHSATIPNGALESLKSILLHHKSGSSVETESWYDNFSITTMGGDISATASYQSGVATVVFDKAPAVEINASNVSIKKMSDDSDLAITSIDKIDAKTYNFTVSGASVDNAYKVLLTDDVFFAGGFTYNPCSFYINSELGVFETIGTYNFDNVSSFAALRNTEGEVGWKLEGDDFGGSQGLQDPVIKTDSQGNNYLAMTNTTGERSNYFVYQLGLDDNAVKKGIIRFSYDEKMSNIDETRNDYINLYLLCKIEGINRYSGASYKQYAVLGRYLNDLGLKFPPKEDSSIYSAASSWEHVKDTSASTTTWERHIIEFDTIENRIRYYLGDSTNLVRSCGIKSYEGIEGLAFMIPNDTVNEIQMDNVKIEVSKLSVGVESVKFGGKVAKANNAIESGFKTLSVKFSDAVALTDNDANITVSGDNIPTYTGAYDSATNTYNITFDSSFPANKTATLTVASSIVSSEYELKFTTDNGIFEATKPVISVSGNTATVSTTVTNTTGNGTDALILVVQYKEVDPNALKLVSVKPVFELVDGVRDISIDNISIVNGANVIKAFVWTGDGTMKPISDFSSEFLN